MLQQQNLNSITPIIPKVEGGTSNVASDIMLEAGNFETLTAKNVQTAFGQTDKKLARFENCASVLLSLDVLNDLIGGTSEIPLQSLQTQMIDGRPSNKEAGATVYDEFGTIGYLDIIEGQIATITTVTTGSKPAEEVVTNYYIEQNPITNEYYIPVGSGKIKEDSIKEKLVRLLFDDVITNTGEQVYDFQTFDKQGFAIFRRNIVEEDKVERINIKVDFRGKVTFQPVEYKGTLFWSGTSAEYTLLEKKENTIYRLSDTKEVYLGDIKISV